MGPSKEELSNYFKNNRKYFDELARHYKQSDPAYYNQYIAPFYGNVFMPSGGRKGGRPAVALFAGMLAVFIMGIVIFFLVNQKTHINKVYEGKDIEENIEDDDEDGDINIKTDPVKILDTLSSIKELGNYEKGLMYYNLGDFDKAEKYLEKVPENDILYKDAREKIKEINKKKGGNKK
jgi:tetratricopeptide (TPR) repeat protein